MDFCSITVWYNPNDLCVKNILTYNSFCKKCYIVDNSASDNSALASAISNAVYLPNHSNLGIAAALNIGCQKALDDGFEFCMTMDQDSSWSEGQLALYLDLCKKNVSEKNVSFCPSAVYKNPRSFLGLVRRGLTKPLKALFRRSASRPDDSAKPEKTDVEVCITSGNVISLAAWDKVGRFYEPFFIDEVDHEFCFRLKENGFEIVKFENCVMNHVLGTPRMTFYPCSSFHKKERLYYIFRNMLAEEKLHPFFFKKLLYPKLLRHRVKELVFNLRFSELHYLIKAYRDYKKGKFGKFGA